MASVPMTAKRICLFTGLLILIFMSMMLQRDNSLPASAVKCQMESVTFRM